MPYTHTDSMKRIYKQYDVTPKQHKRIVATTLKTAIDLFEKKAFTQHVWARGHNNRPFFINLNRSSIDTSQICSCCLMGAVRIAAVIRSDKFKDSNDRTRAFNLSVIQLAMDLLEEPEVRNGKLAGPSLWNDNLNPEEGKDRCLTLLRRSHANVQ